MVRNAAHDSVCACSVDEVVDAVLVRYAEGREIGEGLAERALTGPGPVAGRGRSDGGEPVGPFPQRGGRDGGGR